MTPQRPRSDLPCDNPERFADAKRVVIHYQTLLPAHSRAGAVEQVIGRLNDGVAVETLLGAAVAYARHLQKTRVDAKYGCCCRKFYEAAGEWERFESGECPADRKARLDAEERIRRAAEVRAERAKEAAAAPEQREAVRKLVAAMAQPAVEARPSSRVPPRGVDLATWLKEQVEAGKD